MSSLPGRLPDRVEGLTKNDLVSAGKASAGRDESYVRTASQRLDVTRPAAPVGPLAIKRLRGLLTDRDLAITASVSAYRFMTARQIETLHFADHASDGTAGRIRRRVLERLTAAKVLDRLPRSIGGVRAGSAGYVFRLGTLGHRLVRGDSRKSGSGRHDDPSLTFMLHTLAIAQVAVDLTIAARHAGHVLTIETEPLCWRSFQIGLSAPEVLKPDLFVTIDGARYEDHWFVEIDRGTESLAAVRRKCDIYASYYRSGIEQDRRGVFPRVLWVALDTVRAHKMATAIDKIDAPAGLFATTTEEVAVARLLEGYE